MLAVFMVTNTNDAAVIAAGDAPGTLRQAIFDANNTPNVGGIPDEIHFNIPGDVLHTIQPLAANGALPAISDPVVIDGYTESDAVMNTNGVDAGLNGLLRIELDGTLAGGGDNGLRIVAGGSGSRIQGLSIIRFDVDGISIEDSNNNVIAGNYIGTNNAGDNSLGNGNDGISISGDSSMNRIGGNTPGERNVIVASNFDGIQLSGTNITQTIIAGNLIGINVDGVTSLGNGGNGVRVVGTATSNTIGGLAAGSRNVISGNEENGVVLSGAGVTNNLIVGNFIGTSAAGDVGVGNFTDGVFVGSGASGNTIGGTDPGAGNVISANVDDGIDIFDSDGNTVQGNFIGTDAAGTGDLGNGGHGVEIGFLGSVSDNLIGGGAAGAGNTIAFNIGDGVAVYENGSAGNAIRRNSIFSNAGLGIDLGDNGVTPNDFLPPADDDEGPNRLQNFPELGSATLLGNSIAVTYRVPTDVSNATYPLVIDFYLADADNQEGRTFLASDTYNLADAQANKAIVIPVPAAITNPRIVATATDADGNTSEFSAPILISGPTILGSEPTIIRDDSITGNQVDLFQYRAHSTGKLVVRIDFLHAFGDLDLEVRDQFGNLLAPTAMTSSLDQNFEEIIIPVVSQQRYFIRVFGNGLGGEQEVPYTLELENFPAPVPTAVHLDPTTDTGRLVNDNITADNTPTFFITADVLNFVDTNDSGFFEDPDVIVVSPDAIDALTPAEAGDAGAAIEVTLINTSIPSLAPIVGFATPISAVFPTTYRFDVDVPLADGVYFVTAATRIWDGQADAEGEPIFTTGRSNMSPPLWFTVDTIKPSVVFGELGSAIDGLDPASDTGVASQPLTIVDRITSDTSPTLWGTAEANATVRVFVLNAAGGRVLIGETVAAPFNGNNPSLSGRWTLTSTIDMNDPLLGFAALDGVRQFEIEAEDIAGNLSGGAIFESIVGLPITDDAVPNDFTFDVSGFAGTITDLDVGLNILHTFDSDLIVSLISPTGTVVRLFTTIDGPDDNFFSTTLDDEAATGIAAGVAPFAGRFIPEEALSAFDGENPNGTWTLRIIDTVNLDTGTLLNWSLCFQSTFSAFFDTQGPRVESVHDGFTGVDLLDSKPTGPTPAVHFISIDFIDQPIRDAGFLPHPAVNQVQAQVPGNYRLVGDRVGVIPVIDVIYADNTAAGTPGMTQVTLVFAAPLPDDHYTLTVFDNLRDNAGNRLDGEYFGDPTALPSGDGVPKGDFVASFTVDSVPELGVWAAGTVLIDANGNFLMDGGFSAGDLAFHLGFSSDYIVAGNFAAPGNLADGFDKLAAYGRVGSQWRWLIDFTNDGVPDGIFNEASIDGLPVAGNFDGNAANGDEIGIFTGSRWYFDTDHDFTAGDNASFAANYGGFPFIGDFDGDGDDDVGTYRASQSGGNIFTIDLNTAGAGSPISIDGVADFTFQIGIAGLAGPAGFFGFPGVRERPVAADMNADGVDDIGLWVPDGTALVPGDQGEWFFLVSNNDPFTAAIENTILDRIAGGYVAFTPIPFGNDIYAQFGNSFALPIVGNFDPPAMGGAAPAATVQSVAAATPISTPVSSSTPTAAATVAPSSTSTAAPASTYSTTSSTASTAQSTPAAVASVATLAVAAPVESPAPVSASKKKSKSAANPPVVAAPIVTPAPAVTLAAAPIVAPVAVKPAKQPLPVPTVVETVAPSAPTPNAVPIATAAVVITVPEPTPVTNTPAVAASVAVVKPATVAKKVATPPAAAASASTEIASIVPSPPLSPAKVKVAPIAVRATATPTSAIDAALAASVSGKAKKPATPIGQTSGLLYEAPVATSDGDIDAALELLFASA